MTLAEPGTDGIVRRRLHLEGVVQGIGFRPFIYRLASAARLRGFVGNDHRGVVIEIEGPEIEVASFIEAALEGPAGTRIERASTTTVPPQGDVAFEIATSATSRERRWSVPHDLATCAACIRELFDAADRRHRYPLINCAECGPRFTIAQSMPWDRANTTMHSFELCSACREEYQSPADRRFHAEAVACPDCGPRVVWRGKTEAVGAAAVDECVAAIRGGGVVAVKGVGGFHLVCLAADDEAVARLRRVTGRPTKAFAVMFRDINAAVDAVELTDSEVAELVSTRAPIVLVSRKADDGLSPLLAPFNRLTGVMLPYSPVHHLLARALAGPLVVTSANRADEPIATEAAAVDAGFGGGIDGVLAHDRPIERRADDAIIRHVAGKSRLLRAGRGYSPVRLEIPPPIRAAGRRTVLAMGGHEKAALAVLRDGAILCSQHLGELDSVDAREAWRDALDDFIRLHGIEPDIIACDRHPDFFPTQVAREIGARERCSVVAVDHHHAHFASALLEFPRARIGAIFDGSGLGADGTLWGGEFLSRQGSIGYRREGHLLPFPLPGGEACVRQPWRLAAALLAGAGVSCQGWYSRPDRAGIMPDSVAYEWVKQASARGSGPLTSSVGRLFDGVASLLALRHEAEYSAQPAMELEFLAMNSTCERRYHFGIVDGHVLDWRPVIGAIAEDVSAGVRPADIAAGFHQALARGTARVLAALDGGEAVLTGGCFQNRLLAEAVIEAAAEDGVNVRLPARLPPNDGGLAAGQAVVASLLDLEER